MWPVGYSQDIAVFEHISTLCKSMQTTVDELEEELDVSHPVSSKSNRHCELIFQDEITIPAVSPMDSEKKEIKDALSKLEVLLLDVVSLISSF